MVMGLGIRDAISQIPSLGQFVFLVGIYVVAVYPLPASQGETVPVAVGILGVHPPPVVGRIVRIVPTGIQTESRTEVQCDVVHVGLATAVYAAGLKISCCLRVLLYIRHVFAGVSQVYAAVLVEVVFSGYPHVMPVSFVAKLFVFFYGIYLSVQGVP